MFKPKALKEAKQIHRILDHIQLHPDVKDFKENDWRREDGTKLFQPKAVFKYKGKKVFIIFLDEEIQIGMRLTPYQYYVTDQFRMDHGFKNSTEIALYLLNKKFVGEVTIIHPDFMYPVLCRINKKKCFLPLTPFL